MPRWIRRVGAAPLLSDLVGAIGGRLDGCGGDLPISDVGPIDAGGSVALAAAWDPRSARAAATSRARVLLTNETLGARLAGRPLWIHPRPRRALRGVLDRLYEPAPVTGPWRSGAGGALIHVEAAVDPAAVLSPGVVIGPGAVVGAGVEIGPNATILHDVRIGEGVSIGPSCVIGADGFGIDAAPGEVDPEPIQHVGSVEIGRRASLGALVVVARGTLGATRIGDHARIDAHVQVGHNVRIGDGCIVCAQVGIGGSASIGDGVWIGGQAGIADHCRIGNHARIAAQSGVIGDVPPGATYGGTPAVEHSEWMRGAARVHRELGRRARPGAKEDG